MIRRPPRSTPLYSSAASDVYKRQALRRARRLAVIICGSLCARRALPLRRMRRRRRRRRPGVNAERRGVHGENAGETPKSRRDWFTGERPSASVDFRVVSEAAEPCDSLELVSESESELSAKKARRREMTWGPLELELEESSESSSESFPKSIRRCARRWA